MAKRQPKVSKTMLFTWLMLASLILLFSPEEITNQLHLAFVNLFKPVLSFGRSMYLSTTIRDRPAATHHKTQNSKLKTRNSKRTPVPSYRKFQQWENLCQNLEAELRRERQKVEKLSGLRCKYAWGRAKLLLADVITSRFDALQRKLVINRGVSDGVAVGQFIFGDNSVIGVVSDVSANTATIKLTTDPTSKLKVQVAHCQDPNGDVYIRGIMQGDSKAGAKIHQMKYPVSEGDYVYTFQEPWFVDAPIVVGKVKVCKEKDSNPLLWDVTVKPVCDIEKLENVAIIIMNPEGAHQTRKNAFGDPVEWQE